MFTKTLAKTLKTFTNFVFGAASVVALSASVGVGIVAASAFSSPAQAQPLATPHPPVVQLASISTHPAPGGTVTIRVISDSVFSRAESVAVVFTNGAGATVTYPGYNGSHARNFTTTFGGNGKQTIYMRVEQGDGNANYTVQVPNDASAPDILMNVVTRGNLYELGPNVQRSINIGGTTTPTIWLSRVDTDKAVVRGGRINYRLHSDRPITTALTVNLEAIGAIASAGGTDSSGLLQSHTFPAAVYRDTHPFTTGFSVSNNPGLEIFTGLNVNTASSTSAPDYARIILKPGTNYIVGSPSAGQVKVVDMPTITLTGPTTRTRGTDKTRYGA
ncbi:MAG: hypothetical protein MJE68_05925, partial [Proteobacteria bacterium]|nr:hypothetical protein [Pseudomonadota bacterium]